MPLAHVTLPTRIFEQTTHFFSNVLEFPKIPPPENIPCRAAWFDIGNDDQIHVLEVDAPPIPDFEKEFGRHIAFRFRHARWLRIKDRLEESNFEIIPPQREANVSRFFVHDPNGYCLEFLKDSGL